MKALFIKGFTYGWSGRKGDYLTDASFESMKKLKQTGAEWIALAFSVRQETLKKKEISFRYGETVTDYDIETALNNARKLNLKICLKPVVNCRDQLWRARIGFPDEAQQMWAAWFSEYTAFLVHYAEIAERFNCELFCIGCEMVGTEHKATEWYQVINAIRSVYKGLLTYNANHGKELAITWLDQIDILGTSAYYPVANKPRTSVNEMISNWQPVKARMKAWHERFAKPILFMEIGCRSASGCATMPWDFEHDDLPFDELEQANFYQSALEVFWDQPWFCGFFWWDWGTDLTNLAQDDRGFNIHGKQAEQVLKVWYEKKKSAAGERASNG
ncbi:hypothetical protein SAMN04488134_1211 [Amphibacillus marinus]|uniref:Glycosyl hydrolase family 53 n=1 Tax=Amphibacillus marinus TaxID=872970 RepID=A0A1H8TXQ1_9BACI|nr:glycosyl hydrolase family 53 [Amphibacillus marinus]SEO18387.1 hypothetical protein SAMN04488134_104208 [Amphibacillus marinus]SEO95208.1 hypothetical protein SAMN04488134_1211 [Amphibacillus marinus]